MHEYSMNSISIREREPSSFKSNKSNRTLKYNFKIYFLNIYRSKFGKIILHLIMSSNLALLNIAIPLNNSRASISPLLSVSQMTK